MLLRRVLKFVVLLILHIPQNLDFGPIFQFSCHIQLQLEGGLLAVDVLSCYSSDWLISTPPTHLEKITRIQIIVRILRGIKFRIWMTVRILNFALLLIQSNDSGQQNCVTKAKILS